MIYKIAFAGAPSTGKTTLARITKKYYEQLGLQTILVPEYARIHIELTGQPIRNYEEQLLVTTTQSNLEKALEAARPTILITDSPIFLGEAYAKTFHNTHDQQPFITLTRNHHYHTIFYLPPLPIIHDGIRQETTKEQQTIDQHLKETIRRQQYQPIILPTTRPPHPTN
jgi:nicotinamide riboside kinase